MQKKSCSWLSVRPSYKKQCYQQCSSQLQVKISLHYKIQCKISQYWANMKVNWSLYTPWIWGNRGAAPLILNLIAGWEWMAWHPGRFTTGKGATSTQWIAHQMCLRANLGALEKIFLVPARNWISNLRFSGPYLITIPTELPWLPQYYVLYVKANLLKPKTYIMYHQL